MEKNWFIFKGDHHLGPFSSEDLVRMLQHEKVTQDDLIWREGESDWLPLVKHPALAAFFAPPAQEAVVIPIRPAENFTLKQEPKPEYVDDFLDHIEVEEEEELPPPLPPLPVFDDEPEEELKFEEEVEEEGPPPLPPLPDFDDDLENEEEVVEVFTMPKPNEIHELPDVEDDLPKEHFEQEEERLVFDEYTLDQIEEGLEDDDYDPTGEHKVPDGLWEEAPPWQKTMMISSIVVGVLMSLYFFNWEGADVEATRFSGISRKNKRELTKVVNTTPKVGVRARLALSNTGNEIWLATNHPDEAILYLNLKSISDRTIENIKDAVELRSVGDLLKGGAKFRNIELVSGDRIAEGEYEATIVGYATGWKSRLATYMKTFDSLKTLKFVTKFKPEFKLNLRFLYSVKPPTEFEKLLGESKKKNSKDLAKPFQELMQRHKTFSSLLTNIQVMYKDSLKVMLKGKDVRIFERRYAMEIEPILRDLLLDSNRKHIALMNSDKRRSEDFLKLVEEGKQIGILVSDIVTRTRKYGKMTNKKRKKLAGIFAPRIDDILSSSKKDELRLKTQMSQVLTN